MHKLFTELQLGTLRQHGVTLNLMVHSERYEVSDAGSIYLMEYNAKNVERLCVDLSKRLYKSFHIEFLSYLTPEELGLFAQKVATRAGDSPWKLITRVADRYLSFMALSPTLFSLEEPDTFISLYSPKADDLRVGAFYVYLYIDVYVHKDGTIKINNIFMYINIILPFPHELFVALSVVQSILRFKRRWNVLWMDYYR